MVKKSPIKQLPIKMMSQTSIRPLKNPELVKQMSFLIKEERMLEKNQTIYKPDLQPDPIQFKLEELRKEMRVMS